MTPAMTVVRHEEYKGHVIELRTMGQGRVSTVGNRVSYQRVQVFIDNEALAVSQSGDNYASLNGYMRHAEAHIDRTPRP